MMFNSRMASLRGFEDGGAASFMSVLPMGGIGGEAKKYCSYFQMI
jgi:hypothetical protein